MAINISWFLLAILSIKIASYDLQIANNTSGHDERLKMLDKNVKPILDAKNIQSGNDTSYKNNNPASVKKIKISSNSKIRLNKDILKKSNFQFSDLLGEITETISSTTDYSTEIDDITVGVSSTPASEVFTKPSEVNITTTKSDINSTTEEIQHPKPTLKKKTVSNYNASIDCSCDLTLNSCDISCCCDSECTNKDLAMFPKCNENQTTRSNFQPQYCYSHELLYNSNLSSMKNAHFNDLFCVLKDNLPPKIEKTEKKVIGKLQDMYDTSKHCFGWSESQRKKQQYFDSSKPYNYYDVVWFLQNDTFKTIEIPYSTHNAYCHDRRPLRFLENSQSSCISSLRDLEMFGFYDNFESIYFVSNPSLFNESWYAENKTCPENVCLRVEVHFCNLYKCREFNGTEHQKTVVCDETICNNVITKIKFILYADNSGIEHFKILFGTDSIYLSDGYVTQEFEVVNYLTSNFSNADDVPQHISGNNGYLMGRPIITSAIANHNYNRSNDKSIDKIDFFNANYAYPLSVIKLPINMHKRCILTNVTYNQVVFGENIKSICNFLYNIPKNEENGTFICDLLQDQINSLLSISSKGESIYLSLLGNPWREANQWIKLLVDSSFLPVTGNFSNSETLNCYNLCTYLKYEFAYSMLARQKNEDYKLLGGTKTCVYDESLQLQIIGNKVLLPLTVTIAFYDVFVSSFSEYAKGPNLNLQLPNDFFYPFMSNAPCQHIKIIPFVLIIFYFLIFSNML